MIQSTKADNCYGITKGSIQTMQMKTTKDYKHLKNNTCKLEKYNITKYPFEVNSKTYNTLD